MKKSFITLVLLLFSTFLFSQTPTSFSVQGGYSWINGVVGADIQIGHFGISGGWMPTKMPLSGDKINSIGAALTLYSGNYDEQTLYISLGTATNGYRESIDDGYGYLIETSQAMTIVMIGAKGSSGNVTFKIGGGYGWCSAGEAWTFEAVLGFSLFNNVY